MPSSKSTFHLLAHTAHGTLLDLNVEEAYFPSEFGPLGILPGHDNLIAAMNEAGVMKYVKDGKTSYLTVFGGALWVTKEGVTLLSELMERAEDIDFNRAKAAKSRAEVTIANSLDPQQSQKAKNALAKANARIEARSLYGGEGRKA